MDVKVGPKLFALAIGSALAVGALGWSSVGAWASDYPSRTVKVIIPFSPGGSADTLCRIVSNALSRKWGQTVVIENRPGGNTTVGATQAVHSAPDGYTIFYTGDQTITINPILYPAGYDVEKDLKPVTLIASIPMLLATSRQFPANDLQEFIAYAKANPRKVSYGSSGPGSIQRLAMEAFAARAGIELLHVPYRGSNETVTALLTGEVDATFNGVANFVGHLKERRLKALAVSTADRSSEVPAIAPVKDAGGALADYDVTAWFGYFVPAGVSDDIVSKLQRDVLAVLNEPDVRDALQIRGYVSVGSTPAEFRRTIASDTARWRELVSDGKLKKE